MSLLFSLRFFKKERMDTNQNFYLAHSDDIFNLKKLLQRNPSLKGGKMTGGRASVVFGATL